MNNINKYTTSCRRLPSRRQEEEWDDVAGEWDDIAFEYTKCLYQYILLQKNILPPYRNNNNHNAGNYINKGNPNNTIDNNTTGIIRIIDFGCGTGLLIERFIQYFTKQQSQQHLTIQQQQLEEQHRYPKVHIIGIDTSVSMIRIVREKIRNYGWNDNPDQIFVYAFHANLSHSIQYSSTSITKDDDVNVNMPSFPNTGGSNNTSDRNKININIELQTLLQEWENKVDLIVASSVLSYLPTFELSNTIQIFSYLLKPKIGHLIHSEWTNTITTTTISSNEEDNHSISNTNSMDNDTIITMTPIKEKNGWMSRQAAIEMYNKPNQNTFDIESIETVQWTNVYHSDFSQPYSLSTSLSTSSSSSCNGNTGSSVLIGIVRRR
jgi:SAM-dependent methyltransferase